MSIFGKVTQGDLREIRSAVENLAEEVKRMVENVKKHHARLASYENSVRLVKDLAQATAERVDTLERFLDKEDDEELEESHGRQIS